MSSFRATVENMSKIMDDMGITELDLERQFLFGVYRKHIHLSKQQSVAAPVNIVSTQQKTSTSPQTSGHILKSPMVGVAYLSSEPGAKPFVKIGSTVNAGDTVALVEAMKTFNPVKATTSGVVKEIMVADGTAVEYDTPIMVIE